MISSCCHLHHNSYKQCFLHHFLFFSHEVKKTIKCSLCCYWNCKAIHYEDFSMLEYIKTAEPDCWKTVRLKNGKKKKKGSSQKTLAYQQLHILNPFNHKSCYYRNKNFLEQLSCWISEPTTSGESESRMQQLWYTLIHVRGKKFCLTFNSKELGKYRDCRLT